MNQYISTKEGLRQVIPLNRSHSPFVYDKFIGDPITTNIEPGDRGYQFEELEFVWQYRAINVKTREDVWVDMDKSTTVKMASEAGVPTRQFATLKDTPNQGARLDGGKECIAKYGSMCGVCHPDYKPTNDLISRKSVTDAIEAKLINLYRGIRAQWLYLWRYRL